MVTNYKRWWRGRWPFQHKKATMAGQTLRASRTSPQAGCSHTIKEIFLVPLQVPITVVGAVAKKLQVCVESPLEKIMLSFLPCIKTIHRWDTLGLWHVRDYCRRCQRHPRHQWRSPPHLRGEPVVIYMNDACVNRQCWSPSWNTHPSPCPRIQPCPPRGNMPLLCSCKSQFRASYLLTFLLLLCIPFQGSLQVLHE
jgi:hypothetical protein